MAEWDAESRLEEIKRGQRKGAKAKLAIGTVFLAVGLVMSFYLIFFSGGFAGPLGVLLGFAFLVVAIVGAVLVATGYFDLKSAKVISTAPVGASSTEAQPSTQSEVSGNEPASFLGKEMKWKRGEMKDTWTVEEGGREVGRISGKGTYPFSYTVKGQFETTDFQMVIVKRPDKHWEVGTGQGAKEWARIWNASVTHLSPAVVRTFDGRVFEIRDAGRTD
ncbi:MAG TPA: phage holin family protein, partial [Methanomassiliicoccales archaeon]|nr:phage holin family protein [Methanomassiliicoccales archaeon]